MTVKHKNAANKLPEAESACVEDGHESSDLDDLDSDGDLDVMLPPEPPKAIARPESVLPPPDWRPTPLKVQGKLFVDAFAKKAFQKSAQAKQKLESDRKKLIAMKRRDIKNNGPYKCSISQCNLRFFSKSKQIEHTRDHRHAMEYAAQRQQLSDLLWTTKLIAAFDKNEFHFSIIQTIVEFVDPTSDWRETRPPIAQNPTCTCKCICGFQKFKDEREKLIEEIMAIKNGKERRKKLAQLEEDAVAGKMTKQVMVGKIMDDQDFKFRGCDPKNTMIKYSTNMDPLQTTCICLCYCGSSNVDLATLEAERKPRYLDTTTIQQAHSQNLTDFFRKMSVKYPIEAYPHLRKPDEYLQKSNLQNQLFRKSILADMFRWQDYPICKSLTRLDRSKCVDDNEYAMMKKQATKIFKQICCVAGDCAYRDTRDLPFKIVEKGVKYPILRDEIFAQLIKQTRSNPSRNSCIKVWKLFYLCMSAFTASSEMALVVLSHIATYARGHGIGSFDTIEDIARHCYFAWKYTMEGNLQKVEIADTWRLFVKKDALLKFEVTSFDGSRAMVSVPNYFTVGNVVNMICHYFGIKRETEAIHWMIKGMCNETDVNEKLSFTSPNVSAMLMTSRWQQEKRQRIEAMKEHPNLPELQVKFLIYKRIWNLSDFEMKAYDDPAYRRMIYEQVLREFYEGILKPTLNELIELVAIRIAMFTKGRSLTMNETSWHFLSKFIPTWAKKQYKSTYTPKQWRDQLTGALDQCIYSKLEHKRKDELEAIRDQPRYWTVKRTIKNIDTNNSKSVHDMLYDPRKSKKGNQEEIEKYYRYLSTLNARFIFMMLKSQYYGLSTFAVEYMDITNSMTKRCVFQVNKHVVIIRSYDFEKDENSIRIEYSLKDVKDLELLKVNGKESLRITFKNNLSEVNSLQSQERVIISTDECAYICEYMGDLLAATQDKFFLLTS